MNFTRLNDTGFLTETIGLTAQQTYILETTLNLGQTSNEKVDLSAMNETGIFKQLNFSAN
jgi:hypothetical protein